MFKYIAFLRGINVSGKNRILMSELKTVLESKYKNVFTYLNSGNIIFESDISDIFIIKNDYEKIIKENFGLDIPVLIILREELKEIISNKPLWWGLDNREIYDNIIFIIPPTSYEEVYNCLGEPKKNLEQIERYKNIIFWSYNLKTYQKTNWWPKTASSIIANKITIRTANTIKKIIEISEKEFYE